MEKREIKLVYIAHPIGEHKGVSVKDNVKKIKKIIRDIIENEQKKINTGGYNYEVIPFAPYLSNVISLDDKNHKHREIAMRQNFYMIRSCGVSELWLFGDRVSPGMEEEIDLAEDLGIPVLTFTEETAEWYEEHVNIKYNQRIEDEDDEVVEELDLTKDDMLNIKKALNFTIDKYHKSIDNANKDIKDGHKYKDVLKETVELANKRIKKYEETERKIGDFIDKRL